mmetsp:Transcript_9215/g.10613  ORF Transcript_9215/g.10613 Transcript_9215/m.10613 type:complete len:191 (-) Transcript_9215:1714-2286(-)
MTWQIAFRRFVQGPANRLPILGARKHQVKTIVTSTPDRLVEVKRRASNLPFSSRNSQQYRFHGDDDHIPDDAPVVNFSFVTKDEKEVLVEAKVGQNLLRVAQKNDVELEGACECSIACSTCHVILEPEFYDSLEEACEDEEDMLDMAFGLTETSRLGCQILVSEIMEGTKVTLPKATRNFYVDGHVPEPH